MTDFPPPGMIGLCSVHGDIGRAIRFGQWLNGDGFAVWEHAFVTLPGGLILEAEPGGAQIVKQHHRPVYWCTGIYDKSLPAQLRNPDGVLNYRILEVAEDLKGTPYSFLDYAALSAHRLHVPVPGLQEFIKDSGHEICSQLADDFYQRLGGHIFTDNRWPGYVTPGMLYRRDIQLVEGRG